MSSTILKCRREEGSVGCVFMPTSLDSRSHERLRFKRSEVKTGTELCKLIANHPQNSKIKVEGNRLVSKTSKYAIGVYEEGSRNMSIFEASPYSVQALVDGVVVRVSDTGSEPVASYLDKKKDLINTYAPVKKQRQLRAAVNAVVSDEKIEGYEESREVMKQTIAEAAEDKSGAAALSAPTGVVGQMRELLPPFDLEATSPGAIFDFSSLFPEALVAAIDPSDKESTCHTLLKFIHEDFRASPVLEKGDEDPWSEMKNLKTLSQLGRLFMAAKQEKRKNFAKLVNILISMMYLYNIKRKKNWTHSDIYAPEPLAQRLAELYTCDKTVGAQIDREGTNKLFAHIVVFVLRLTPFWEFDFSDLKTDLNVQSKDLLAILSFCGISVKSRTGLAGKLTAPLTVHTNAGGKGAPKRRK